MPRYDDNDEWDEDYDDDIDTDDDEEPTIPCPHCRQQIHEDAPRCPYCERYISTEDAPPVRKPWWIYLGVIVCLYLVYCWIRLS